MKHLLIITAVVNILSTLLCFAAKAQGLHPDFKVLFMLIPGSFLLAGARGVLFNKGR